jgi:hypothetical protein
METYKTPKLMAIPTPIFSAVRIWTFHRIFQGSKARDTSIIADHTKDQVSSILLEHVQRTSYSLAWKFPYLTEGLLSTHVPGRISRKVLAMGLHCVQGTVAAGIANTARVVIAKHT